MFASLIRDLQEIILKSIPNHYLTLFRLISKNTLDMSNRRFISFITLPVYDGKNIYDPETNYKYWRANQLNLPINISIIKINKLLFNDDVLRFYYSNSSYTPNDKWFNYIINNMRITKFHLINKSPINSICTIKPLFKGKKPLSPLNNYKEWKKYTLGLSHSHPIRSNKLSTYKLQDGFNPKIYNESFPWFNFIHINMTVE